MRENPNIDALKNCRNCGKLILLSDSVRGQNGTRVPLEKHDDGIIIRHTCQQDEETIISQAIEYIAATNRRLKTAQLRLIREPEAREDHE